MKTKNHLLKKNNSLPLHFVDLMEFTIIEISRPSYFEEKHRHFKQICIIKITDFSFKFEIGS